MCKAISPSPPRDSIEYKQEVVSLANRYNNNLKAAREINAKYETKLDEKSVRLWREELTVPQELAKSLKKKKVLACKIPRHGGELLEWMREERKKGNEIHTLDLKVKARTLNPDPTFSASNGWFYRFLRRNSISKRAPTHIMQKLCTDFIESVKTYLGEIRKER